MVQLGSTTWDSVEPGAGGGRRSAKPASGGAHSRKHEPPRPLPQEPNPNLDLEQAINDDVFTQSQ